MTRRSFPLVIAGMVASCALPAPQQAGTAGPPAGLAGPSATPLAGSSPLSVGAEAPKGALPSAASRRTVLRDPEGGGKVLRVKQYWDYEANTPFEVEGFQVKHTPDTDRNGRDAYTLIADVKLPIEAKLKAYVLAQAPGAEAQDAGDEVFNTSDDADIMEAGDDFDLADPGDAVVDESDEVDAENASGEYDEAEEARFLDQPHKVVMKIDNASASLDADDVVTLEDENTNEVLTIRYDQEWTRFSLESADGKLAVSLTPGGGYVVDGVEAPSLAGAVGQVVASPLVRGASPHALAMLVARTGRVPPEGRNTMAGPQDHGYPSYALLAVKASDVHSIHELLAAVADRLIADGDDPDLSANEDAYAKD